MGWINIPDYDFGEIAPSKPQEIKQDSSNSLVLLGLGLLIGYALFKQDQSLIGGKGDNTKPSEVDQNELKQGIKVEMEHTTDPAIAEEIALDHLTEDAHYYTHLAKIHKENPIKSKKGGLTSEGRSYFKEVFGSHLKPGVMRVETLEDLKRWGSWARRFYGRSDLPPLKDDNGQPTRLALDAKAWGCKIPKTKKEAKVIAKRGREALRLYRELKKKGHKKNDSVRFRICQ